MDDVKPRGTHDLLPGDRIWISGADGGAPPGWAVYRGTDVWGACRSPYDLEDYLWWVEEKEDCELCQNLEYYRILEQLLGDGSIE